MKLKYVICALLFFLMIQFITTDSYAFTWEDYITFCHNIRNTDVTYADTIWCANRIYNNRTKIQNIVENAGYRLSDYNNYFAFKQRGENTWYLFIYKNRMGIEWNKKITGVEIDIYISNASINTNSTNGIGINLSNFTREETNTTVWYGQNGAVGLVDYMTNFGNTFKYMWNKFVKADLLRTNLDGLKSPYLIAKRICRKCNI